MIEYFTEYETMNDGREVYRLIRDVTRKEFPWLTEDFKKGDTVFKYFGNTYGRISRTGTACTVKQGILPFFEIPNDCLAVVEE